MKRYVKKPIVVEAEQWFYVDYDREAGHGFSMAHNPIYHLEVGFYRHPDIDGKKECEHCGNIMHKHGWMDTLEGGHTVCPGDWIIRGIAGEMYPCKNRIFKETYDEYVEESFASEMVSDIVERELSNEERNPAHFCMGCDNYLGFRGFCSDKCHNDHYDSMAESLEISSNPELMAGIKKSMEQINNGEGIPLSELYLGESKHIFVDDVNPMEDTFK